MCQRGETEVGGFGITKKDDLLYVEDFCLVGQTCSAVTVEFDDNAVGAFFDDRVDEGLHPSQFARIWIHTHPCSSVDPSGTDEATFARVFGASDWSVMCIIGRTGNTSYARLQFTAGPGGQFMIPIAVDWSTWPLDAERIDEDKWDREYLECVTIAQWGLSQQDYNYYYGHGAGYPDGYAGYYGHHGQSSKQYNHPGYPHQSAGCSTTRQVGSLQSTSDSGFSRQADDDDDVSLYWLDDKDLGRLRWLVELGENRKLEESSELRQLCRQCRRCRINFLLDEENLGEARTTELMELLGKEDADMKGSFEPLVDLIHMATACINNTDRDFNVIDDVPGGLAQLDDSDFELIADRHEADPFCEDEDLDGWERSFYARQDIASEQPAVAIVEEGSVAENQIRRSIDEFNANGGVHP